MGLDETSEEVLVLDSSTFIQEIGLTSQKGSALKHYLYRRGTQLVVPEAAAEEYERHLARVAKGKIEQIQRELAWLAQFCGGIEGWSAPGASVIEDRAKALASGDDLRAIFLSETDDAKERARLRDEAERPPAHRKSGKGDCRIWEQCLDLLSTHDVVFVARDQDFRSHRRPEELHPTLHRRSERSRVQTKSHVPSRHGIVTRRTQERDPSHPRTMRIFEFLYREIDEMVQELESNSGCRATSTGEIKQARFTTDAPELIEVRLEVEDTWKSADGVEVLPFQLTGTCHYHLGDERLADLKADLVRLSRTQLDGSIRAVEGRSGESVCTRLSWSTTPHAGAQTA